MELTELEKYFFRYRLSTIGCDAEYESPYGIQKVIYGDWIASGRLYHPIEEKILKEFGPYAANTHTEASETGSRMTFAYRMAYDIIKKHVNAGTDDILITAGSGMTTVINKFQRILGLRSCGLIMKNNCLRDREKPVVFITHMEHHSNQTSWYATTAEVVVIQPGKDLLIDMNDLEKQLIKYKNRKFKLASVTACSNVTGIETPYYKIAKLMHQHGGLCFVDYAASAPYCRINMHPDDPLEKLDAIFFSPHKFLGGPGSSGVLVFDKSMYHNQVPDHPGGGTVDWTNPWGEYKFVDNIEAREDGGTPGFLQAIRTALTLLLKEKMTIEKIKEREKEMLQILWPGLKAIEGIKILADNVPDRLSVVSFYHEEIHYNLLVKLLSDRFGVQTRGGCDCAGTYGHYLLEVSYEHSKKITKKIDRGDLSNKPGWVRLSLHPTNTNAEIIFILHAINEIVKNHRKWSKDYDYSARSNEFFHKSGYTQTTKQKIEHWFKI
jgi:selenocysteine lyase/cysteine desulfurase